MPEEGQLDLLRRSLAAYLADGDYIATLIGAWNDEKIAPIWELTRAYRTARSGDAAWVDARRGREGQRVRGDGYRRSSLRSSSSTPMP